MYMAMMGVGRTIPLACLVIGLVSACSGSGDISPYTLDLIKQSHDRMLTVDGAIIAGDTRQVLSLLADGRLDAAFLIVPVPSSYSGRPGGPVAREAAMRGIERIKRETEGGSNQIHLSLAPEDAYRLEKEGRRAVYIGIGDGSALGGDVSTLLEFRRQGVRCLRLCGTSGNDLGATDHEMGPAEDPGLSDLGRRVVEQCGRTGLIIDVAGCSERTIMEVLAASRGPVIATHGAARALNDRTGNLSDAMIRGITGSGGVVLVSLEQARLVGARRSAQASVADVADHIAYMVRIGGIEGVGIASSFGDGGGVVGCRDPGEALNLSVELLRRGYDEHDLESIWGGNLMRVFRQVEDQASER